MFGKKKNDAPTSTRWEDMPKVEIPTPSDDLLPEIPKDSTWEFTTHDGSVETFTGSRLDRDHSEFQIMKIVGYEWIQTGLRCGWTPAVIIEPVGGINRFSVQNWRKVEDAAESSPETV